MKTLMKVLALCLCLALTALSFAACDAGTDPESGSVDRKTAKSGIIQFISHPSLDNCSNGIIKGLTEAGVPEANITRQIGSDASASADCDTYAKQMVAQQYDLIFAVATPAATAAADIRLVTTSEVDISLLLTPSGAEETAEAIRASLAE